MKQFPRRPGEGVNRQVPGEDDGHGIKNRPVDVLGGGENDVVQVVLLSRAVGEFAIDVFHHHDGAVDDDSKIDRADRQQIRGHVASVQKDESEKKPQRNGQRDNHGSPEADQESYQDDENQNHPALEIGFHSIRSNPHEIAAIVKRANLDVGRQEAVIQLVRFLFDAGKHVLGLVAAKHQNNAFHHVIIILKAELSQARRVADPDFADIANAHRNAVVVAHDDVAYVRGVLYQAQAAHVEKLASLRIEAAPGVGIIGLKGRQNRRDGDVIAVNLGGIEQHLVLHYGAAKSRIVRHSRNRFISALNHPILEGLQLLGTAIRALDHVAINQARRAAERR